MDAINKDKSLSFREKLSAKLGAPQPKWFWGVAGLFFLLSLVGLAEPSGVAFLVFFIIIWLVGFAIWLMHAADAFRNSSIRRGLLVLLLPGYLGRYFHKHCTNLFLRRLVSTEALGALLIIVTAYIKNFDGTIFDHQDSKSDSASMTTQAEAGFASPQDVFAAMKSGPDSALPFSRVSLFPPEERPLAAYTGVAMARFMSAIETDVDKKKESEQGFTDLITKYDLADQLEFTTTEDEAKLHAMAAKAFSNMDLLAFMADLDAYMKKHKPSSVDVEKAKPVSLKGLKTEGNEAKATMVSSDGTEEPLVFIKSGGRWFVSWERTFNNSEAGNDITTELSLRITFDSERSLTSATAKRLLEGVAYDRSMPAKLEKTKFPLQATLSFMKPAKSDSQAIINRIKHVPGVKQVESSFAAEIREGMQELKSRRR